MRFGIGDESDKSDASSIYSYTSDESDFEVIPKRYSEPVSHLGRKIRGFVDSSDSETESEDDWGLLPRVHGIGASGSGSSSKVSGPSLGDKGKQRAVDWHDEPHDEPRKRWGKAAEEAAMRDGRKVASDRRARLREIHLNARLAVTKATKERTAREEEEMTRLLEGLVIQQAKKEEEVARKFSERENKLWADVEAAIKQAERAESEKRAAEIASARRKKEEEEARTAAAEKEAISRRAQAEEMAKNQMAKQKADAQAKEAKAEEDRQAAERKVQEEEKAKAADTRGRTSSEWRKWVEKQRGMKKEVIDVIKADKATRTGLRTSMRLITRNMGQVTNSKETILRVTNDLHKLLSEQLPSAPTPSSPTALDASISKPHAYLLSHLSKALIKQAESEVSAKSEAAFPLARVIMGLFLRGHGALCDVVFARFVKKCPWVVPFYPSKQPDQSREEYEKSTGRGSDETKSDYIARMAGITSLYFAILQTPLSSLVPTLTTIPTPSQLPSLIHEPFRFPTSWTWLANACRDPMSGMEPTAQLITAWIETVGKESIRVFGDRQVGKVLDAVYIEGIEGGKIKGDGEAARQRLALVLQSWKTNGIAYPNGREWE